VEEEEGGGVPTIDPCVANADTMEQHTMIWQTYILNPSTPQP